MCRRVSEESILLSQSVSESQMEPAGVGAQTPTISK